MTFSTDFAQALEQKFRNDLALRQAKEIGYSQHERPYIFTVEAGQKFDRIVQQREGDAYSRSVHAFVEKSTGKLIKAAGWKAPAKRSNGELQSQFTLDTPEGFQEALSAADKHGGYLYL